MLIIRSNIPGLSFQQQLLSRHFRQRDLKADIQGVKKEEVKVEVEVEEGDVLKISGERDREKEEKNSKWHRVERSS
ncbi:class I heat shock protein 3 [Carex littledalei]|uniref:Class I heat shock protein 3 n=1 Tax=Carex littledalei TaxID=544730 RepID=A0A833QZ13_9POAL|nr:class I heat shock protein 3 [Carex littledalei]